MAGQWQFVLSPTNPSNGKTATTTVSILVTDPTGIEDINKEQQSNVRQGIYDLQGRKVEHTVSSGLYISNGQKIYVK